MVFIVLVIVVIFFALTPPILPIPITLTSRRLLSPLAPSYFLRMIARSLYLCASARTSAFRSLLFIPM
jgi:hypothetical protein